MRRIQRRCRTSLLCLPRGCESAAASPLGPPVLRVCHRCRSSGSSQHCSSFSTFDLRCQIRITDVGLALQRLHYLNLTCCNKITDASIVALGQHFDTLTYPMLLVLLLLVGAIKSQQLQHLALRCCKITDVGLAMVAGLRHTKRLDLRGCSNITDVGLARIAALKKLQYLNIGSCRNITNGGLASVAGLKQLQRLDLHNC